MDIIQGEYDDVCVRSGKNTFKCLNCSSTDAVDGISRVCFICEAAGKLEHRIKEIHLCKERGCRNEALHIPNISEGTDPSVNCPVCYEDGIKFWVTLSECGHRACLECVRDDQLFKLNNGRLTWNEATASFSMQW